jgi:hypothetical protein
VKYSEMLSKLIRDYKMSREDALHSIERAEQQGHSLFKYEGRQYILRANSSDDWQISKSFL